MAYIKFDGTRSDDIGLILENDMTHISSSRDVETVNIAGRDGSLLIDNNRLNTVEQPFPFIVKPKAKTVGQVSQDIAKWLDVKGYKDLEKSWDDKYIYKATYLETFEVSEVIRQFGRVQLTFLLHPIKYLKDGQKEITVTTGKIINNRGNQVAHPIIKLTGTGDTTITINGRQTKLKGIQGELIWDTERKLVYKGNFTSQWDKIVAESGKYNTPYLDTGNNKITFTGNFTMKMTTNEGDKI